MGMGRLIRKQSNDDKYVITHIGQLVFIFDAPTGKFINVWTIDNLDNTKPGTLKLHIR